MLYPCPACGFEVFQSPAGGYELCPVCDWEDDELQLRFPALEVGANASSLFDWQKRVLPSLPLEMTVYGAYRRSADWRPLTPSDCSHSGALPASGKDYFDALGTETPRYYWRSAEEQGGNT